jgi:hypothetical protein
MAKDAPRYPLEPLIRLRDGKAGEAARALAESVRVREEATRVVRAAESHRDAHGASVAAVKERERASLLRGDLRAADLGRGDAWSLRANAEKTALEAAVGRARADETKASDGAKAAQADLAARQAEAEVVAAHLRRWEGERSRWLEAREEEASFEAWRPKR